jgi:hypothetical protein
MQSLGKWVVRVVACILCLSALTYATERAMVKMQGVVMSVDFKKKNLVVNERLFIWNQQTKMHDDNGSAATFERLKPSSWVYIEGAYDQTRKITVATKIYLIPKQIDAKDRHRYPFMQ